MNLSLLGTLLIIILVVFIGSSQVKIECFEDIAMRPWFGYEPGYGPGWNRKGCCNVPVPPNMKSS
jgi:hypothetical protein